MEHQLKELIQKNLPELAAKELAGFIDKAIKDQKELDELHKKNTQTEKEAAILRDEITTLKNEKNAVEVQRRLNDVTEKRLSDSERQQRIQQLTYELQVEKATKENIFALVSLFVKNPRAIELISSDYIRDLGPSHYNQQTGVYEYPESHTIGKTETREKTENK